ncbi:unnamed protein product [Tilletia controversa]|uniref:Uncharacterized protein n=1 Tax=Tilletia controversa TaxID=13291 RepID=A0A8X7SXG6_9BASI|nr:hypothetical protein A4X06_0g3400 [Tilletia controversa]CAD6915766.1 unnamed protein product [Tilletia controversa]CAD6931319.1 unnamed protein product [Tilletia controversa]CAD6962470.1 unnamed protein product [Tilletia controversa]CAD6974896.1 unnamed protein product [Tilletia controversa]
MGLIIVLLRWTYLVFSVRAAHKAINQSGSRRRPGVQPSSAANGRRLHNSNSNPRRGRPARRKQQDRSDVLRTILTRFFVWILYRRAEGILDGIGKWILFYDTVKTLFLFWLLVSHDFAASQLFHTVLEPIIQPYEPLIDLVALRVIRGFHAFNFLSLLFVTHLSHLIPPTLSKGAQTAFDRIADSFAWLEAKLTERRLRAVSVHDLDDAIEGDAPRRSRSGSPPPFLIPPSRAALHSAHATLPGSWRPLHSPEKASRPGLPDAWGASTSRAGPSTALPTRRIVSNGNGSMPASTSASNSRTNGYSHATYSARALSKLRQPPANDFSPSVPRVRLMPDWPDSPNASSSDLTASIENGAQLGRPPSPPYQLARAAGLGSHSSQSGLPRPSDATRIDSSSANATPRKRKKRESLDEKPYDEDSSAGNAKEKDSIASKSKPRTPKRAGKASASTRVAKSNIPVTAKGKERQRPSVKEEEAEDPDRAEMVEPARKRTRTVKKEAATQDEMEIMELAPSYSTRTLRARPNRGSSSNTPSIASPPPPETNARPTTSTSTSTKTQRTAVARKTKDKPASPAKTGAEGKKKLSSTSAGTRTRGLNRPDGAGGSGSAATTEAKGSGSSGDGVVSRANGTGTVRQSRRT